MESYLASSFTSRDMVILEYDLDILLSCAACLSELCTLTAAKSEPLFKRLLSRLYARSTAPLPTSYTTAFEVLLRRSVGMRFRCVSGEMSALVDLPCVSVGLCGCSLRPVYSAVFYGNLDLLKLLLRYGAEVMPSDLCYCDARCGVHPLVRVYDCLRATSRGRSSRDESRAVGFARCHLLTVLAIPVTLISVREVCLGFAKTVSSECEYDDVVNTMGSLQHLCRLLLRVVLSRTHQLPLSAEQLPLPSVLKKYILYE